MRDGFYPMRRLVHERVRNPRDLIALSDEHVARWAGRTQRFFHLPGLVDELYVKGFEHLPRREEPAPILAFSHKKIHDAVAVILFMGGRPLERFHDLTFVAQGGLFGPIYVYRDLMPGMLQRYATRLAAWVARRLGRVTDLLFRSLHGHPVFRDEKDVPPSRAEFEAPEFAGHLLMGMNYEAFMRYAAGETRRSIIRVQRDLVERNRTFLILPEGIYRHDGAVAELQDFLAVSAFRKQRYTSPVSLAYDELCPDRWGRISAWAVVSPTVPAPKSKAEMAAFTRDFRTRLQNSSTITFSSLIGIAICEKQAAPFTLEQIRRRCFLLASQAVRSGFPYDPGLLSEHYLHERWARFVKRRAGRYLKAAPGRQLVIDPEALARFADSERTCNDLVWNRNAAQHFADTIGP